MDIAEPLDLLTEALFDKLRAIGPERVTSAAQLQKLRDEVDEVAELLEPYAGTYRGGAEAVMDEVADVVIVCVGLSRALGFKSDELFRRVLAKAIVNAGRDWYPTSSGTARHTPEEV